MRMEFNDEPYAHGPVKVELEEEEIRVVKANRDGTYQVLVFTGEKLLEVLDDENKRTTWNTANDVMDWWLRSY